MRLGTIVVGMDFNEPSLTAARWTAETLAPDAELILVHSIEIRELPAFLRSLLPPYDQVVAAARDEAERTARGIARSFGLESVRLEISVGRPAETISHVARESNADLIVVGERSHRRTMPSVLGSTADQLVRCAPTPVLLARDLPDGPPEHILAPVDEHDIALEVMAWADYMRERFDSALTVLYALRPGLYGGVRGERSEMGARRTETLVREAATNWIEERLTRAGVDTERASIDIRIGEPAFEIVDAAEHLTSALIVMGSRSARAISPALLGGVATAVLHGASHPVLVIPGGPCAPTLEGSGDTPDVDETE